MLEHASSKNLYLPEPREGGVPRFMGNAGDGSKRSWQLDFRCAAVRRHTGGRGIVLLSATPAKNSPLEFYNLIQYIDPAAWTRLGILDPEQFIDRYLRLEMVDLVNSKLDIEQRSAVVGFTNLHELRSVIFRYGEFKTAEDVGLKLPEPKVEMVEVDMNPAQEKKYEHYVLMLTSLLSNPMAAAGGESVLGYLARLALVAIHPALDEGYTWKTAGDVRDPSSPKFDALADRVMENKTCGHIVFVDNVAAHYWVREVLVRRGISRERIAILNAEVASASADRQRIAQEFNGSLEADPKYDIVIANAIAYEGIDLQTRTCAIHHLDLPWEPATLQQRNGRGVRQGNTLGAIGIYYYFARRSQDGLRFNLIQGKRGWMTQLIQSQDRDTNNPGAQMNLGPEEILLLISREPEKTRERLEAIKAKREAEAREKIATEAARLLTGINSRFRRAEKARDPADAARLRQEGEERLKQLAQVPSDVWPWAETALVVRERALLVPSWTAGPVFEGLRVAIPATWNPEKTEYFEFGKIDGLSIALRALGEIGWQVVNAQDPRLALIRPEHHNVAWPAGEDAAQMNAVLKAKLNDASFRYSEAPWLNLRWKNAPDAWSNAMWSEHGRAVLQAFRRMDSYIQDRIRLPVVGASGLSIRTPQRISPDTDVVLPMSGDGFRAFLELAPKSGLPFRDLATCASAWWGRNVPQNLLTGGPVEEA